MSVVERRGGFQARIDYKDATGKWRQRYGPMRDGKRAAEKDEAQLLADREQGKPIKRDRETVEKFLTRWLAYKKTHPKCSAKTWQGYDLHVRTRWIPAIGHMAMTELYANPDAIIEVQTDWLTNGVECRNRGGTVRRIIPSSATVHHYRATLHAALNDNVQWHAGSVPNPSAIVKGIPPLDSEEEVVTLSQQEARALIETAMTEPWWSDMRTLAILMALDTAMRPGEVYGVRRRDVDRARARVQIRQTVVKLRGERPKVKPNHAKNKASKTPVDLGELAVAVLARAAVLQEQQLQAAGDAWEDHEQLVFTDPLGGPLDEQSVRRWNVQLLAAAGVTRIKVKDLRHTTATLLLEEGVDLKSVSARLRHSRTSVTGNVYAHVTPPMRTHAVAAVTRLYGQPGTEIRSNIRSNDETEAQDGEQSFAF